MPDLPLLHPDSLSPPQRELYDRITTGPRARDVVPVTDTEGHLTGPFNALLYAPTLGEAVQSLGARVRFGLSLTDRERELATVLVAARLNSPYELTAHRQLALAAGITPAEIDSLTRTEIPDSLAPREQTILHLCTTLLDSPTTAHDHDLGPQLLVELTILVGYYQLLARLLTVAGLDRTP